MCTRYIREGPTWPITFWATAIQVEIIVSEIFSDSCVENTALFSPIDRFSIGALVWMLRRWFSFHKSHSYSHPLTFTGTYTYSQSCLHLKLTLNHS